MLHQRRVAMGSGHDVTTMENRCRTKAMNSRCAHHPDGKAQCLLVSCGCGRPHAACNKRRQRPMSEQESSPTLVTNTTPWIQFDHAESGSDGLVQTHQQTINSHYQSPQSSPSIPSRPPLTAASTASASSLNARWSSSFFATPPVSSADTPRARSSAASRGGPRRASSWRRSAGSCGWAARVRRMAGEVADDVVCQLHFGMDGTEEVRDGNQDDGRWRAASVIGHRRDAILRGRDDGRIGRFMRKRHTSGITVMRGYSVCVLSLPSQRTHPHCNAGSAIYCSCAGEQMPQHGASTDRFGPGFIW